MTIKDFTIVQRDAWVVQETAKCATREACVARIETEVRFLKSPLTGALDSFPNSTAAHRMLIDTLEIKRDTLP